jgi:hypothetical protein
MSTRYVYRRTTTVTVVMADPGEVDGDGEPACATTKERDESAREWAEQALPLDDYGEDWVTVEHGPVECVLVASSYAPAEERER